MHDDHVSAGNTAGRHSPLRRVGAVSSTALVLTMLAACPGLASPSKAASSPDVATSPAVAARLVPDAGVTASAASVQVEKAPADFRGALVAIHTSLSLRSWNDWQILVDNPERKERLAWLAKDFEAQVFRQAVRVDEAHLHAKTSAGLLHVGLLMTRFPTCKQLVHAHRAVVKAGRSNFALPALTMFRSKVLGHSLLFLFSETTLQPQVIHLLDRYDSLLGTDVRCTDGK